MQPAEELGEPEQPVQLNHAQQPDLPVQPRRVRIAGSTSLLSETASNLTHTSTADGDEPAAAPVGTS